MASHGKLFRRAQSTISAILPFEHGATMYFFLRRASAAGTSGQASSRCQALLRSAITTSDRPLILKRGRQRSRLRRCSTSSLENGIFPVRTSSMPGWYSPRQASANAIQSWLLLWGCCFLLLLCVFVVCLLCCVLFSLLL